MPVTQIEQTLRQHAQCIRLREWYCLLHARKRSTNHAMLSAQTCRITLTGIQTSYKQIHHNLEMLCGKFGRQLKNQKFGGKSGEIQLNIRAQEEDAEHRTEMQHSPGRENQRDINAIRAKRRAPERSNSSTWQTDSTNTQFTLRPQRQSPRNRSLLWCFQHHHRVHGACVLANQKAKYPHVIESKSHY